MFGFYLPQRLVKFVVSKPPLLSVKFDGLGCGSSSSSIGVRFYDIVGVVLPRWFVWRFSFLFLFLFFAAVG